MAGYHYGLGRENRYLSGNASSGSAAYGGGMRSTYSPTPLSSRFSAAVRPTSYTVTTTPHRHYVVCVERNERRRWRYDDPGLPLY